MDLRYDVDLSYDTDYDCEAAGCDSICRCGSISNPHIRSVNSWVIANHFADSGDPIQYYAIERFCSRLSTDDFRIEWSGGYYGDEIDTVELKDAAKADIVQIKNLRGQDLVEFALKNEYDDVLPQHKNREWAHAEKISFKYVVLGNINRRDIDKGRVEFYKRAIANRNKDDYNPVLLCELHEGLYRVIDGYHRFTAIKELGIQKIDIIYYERENSKILPEFHLGGAL